eukprot:scaffold60018_cov57-Phaeocystis_antarctica.AAC.2
MLIVIATSSSASSCASTSDAADAATSAGSVVTAALLDRRMLSSHACRATDASSVAATGPVGHRVGCECVPRIVLPGCVTRPITTTGVNCLSPSAHR